MPPDGEATSRARARRRALDDGRLVAFIRGESEQAKRLIRLGADRVEAGRRQSLRHARVWAAVDLAFDGPFYQCNPTIIRHLISHCKTAEDVKNACELWGVPLSEVFCAVEDEGGKTRYELNAPVFFSTIVPVVRSYVTIRLSKLFNERNKTPLFEYLPLNYTTENRVRCEIITDLAQQMVQQFGYKAVLRQMILQSLLYSTVLMFPLEPWYVERTSHAGETITTKQGIRYILPHVTRIFMDRAHPPATLNTETGAEYAGYWTVARWGDIASRDSGFFNLDRVPIGADPASEPDAALYLREIFPCTLEFPKNDLSVGPDGGNANRRETAYYSENDRDKGVLLSTIFMRIVPREYGISDDDEPVWIRLIYAADQQVISACVFPYRPVTYCGYDADQGRAINPSLALEIVPFQDQLSNLLSQMILTVKRNLSNIIFYDVNVIDPAQVSALKRHTQAQYQSLNFIGFDSFAERVAQRGGPSAAIHQVRFDYADIYQILQAFNTFMTTLERMLNFSAQELGGQATHQQSKAEVEIIAQATSQRLAYTGSYIDDAISAWKSQIYTALCNYYRGEFISQISADVPGAERELTEMGFRLGRSALKGKLTIRGDSARLLASAVPYAELFASDLPGPKLRSDMQTAQAMLLAIQALASNPLTGPRLDPESIRDLILHAARLSGADADFDVRLLQQPAQGQAAQPEQIAQAVLQVVSQQFAKPIAEQITKMAELDATQERRIAELTQAFAALKQVVEKLAAAVVGIGQAAAQTPPLVGQTQPPLSAPPAEQALAEQGQMVGPV